MSDKNMDYEFQDVAKNGTVLVICIGLSTHSFQCQLTQGKCKGRVIPVSEICLASAKLLGSDYRRIQKKFNGNKG